MFALIRQAAMRFALAALFVVPFLSLTGCELTYANRSREEGMRLYSEKMYTDAAGAFRNAIRQDPRDFRSHFYLGVCYEETKLYQQAFQTYRTALQVMTATPAGKDEDVFRLQVLETLANAVARYDDREGELNRIEQEARAANKAELWFLLAKVYRIKGDADSALEAYRRAAHWDTASFAIRKEFGLYLLDPLNQQKDAEYYLRQAYRLNPDDQAVNLALNRLGVTNPLPAYRAKDGTGALPPYRGIVPSAGTNISPPPTPPGPTVQTPRD